ncbi:uncharacterized protein LOC127044641 [Gopherus flavomarginatus]|uniref:uncharacterized protein LOC127044641 n=1 Tax=Gopherus flavomarginatus TaxID=286002 RepID=UPI0021CBB636|nr:uncharacterized protein LOC127044641 [Gopherus flavomarginatus]
MFNRCAKIHLRQAQLSVTRAENKTVGIDCEASGIQNFRSAVIHWYRHRPGEVPQQILYISSSQPVFDKISNENKFNCEKKPDQPISTLVVNEIAPNDGATYYCAYWDRTVLESHRQPAQLKPVRMLLVQVLIVASVWSYGAAQVQLTQDQLSITRKPTKTQQVHNNLVRMLLLQVFLLASVLWSYGEAQVLVQSQLSITKAEDRTARIDCHVSGITLSNAYIHWYRQRPDAALERILYFSSGTPVFDQDSGKEKFEADKQLSKSTCILTVKKTTTSDSATYYCAAWDHTALKNYSHSVQKLTLYSQLHTFKYMKPQLPPNPASYDRTRHRNPLLVSATRV